MRLPKITKVLLIVQLVLLVCICCMPSKNQLDSITGLWGRRIVLNRVRDFCFIPVSFGTAVCLLGSACPLFKKMKFTAKFRRILLLICAIMTICGIYWTARIVRMERIIFMPTQWWLFFLNNPFVFSLWWTVDGILALLVRPSCEMKRQRYGKTD